MSWLQPNLKYGVMEGTHKVYEERIDSYMRLLRMMNCIHMKQLPSLGTDNQTRFKAFVGSGNNSSLIKHLIERRFWWQIQNKLQKNINFLWTQLKKVQFFRSQRKGSKPCIKERQVDKDFALPKNQSKLMTIQQYRMFTKRTQFPEHVATSETRVHNHFPFNFLIGNKKNLYYNLKEYLGRKNRPIFNYLPLTFHVKNGTKDPQFQAFLHQFQVHIGRLWIVKPGEVTNQGNGIRVVKQLTDIQKLVNSRQKHRNGQRMTHIIQLYLDRPLLYHNRKFDLRHYMLFTSIHGLRRAYWHQEGYVRTASINFSSLDFNPFIHLTNDAVQKHGEFYGKYEPANKLSYMQLNNYIKEQGGQFMGHIIPKMRSIAYDIAMSSLSNLDPQRLEHNFQIFGLDFMIDKDFKPYLIEVNTNPCLEIVSPLLARIIPNMLDQALRLSLDVVFPPPGHFPNTQKHQTPSCQLGGLRWWLLCEEGEQFRVARREEQQEEQFSSQEES